MKTVQNTSWNRMKDRFEIRDTHGSNHVDINTFLTKMLSPSVSLVSSKEP